MLFFLFYILPLMKIFKSSYTAPCLFMMEEEIHLRGILSDLTLSIEPLCWSPDFVGFPLLLMPAGHNGGGRVLCFVARVVSWIHQTQTQQDGWHLLLAYCPSIGNNKPCLSLIPFWLKDSNQPSAVGLIWLVEIHTEGCTHTDPWKSKWCWEVMCKSTMFVWRPLSIW